MNTEEIEGGSVKKTALFSISALIIVSLLSCLVVHPLTSPPPPKKEIRSARPGPLFVWVDGYWKWTGSEYTWIRGHWVKAPKGKVWVQGRWEKRGAHWVWISGHWKKG